MKRKRIAVGTLGLALAGAALVFAAAGSGAKSAPFKAAWIYVGPHNDGGWSQAHDNGRLYVQKKLGSKVQTTYKELVPEGPAVTQTIESLDPRRQQDHLRARRSAIRRRWPRRRRSTPT